MRTHAPAKGSLYEKRNPSNFAFKFLLIVAIFALLWASANMESRRHNYVHDHLTNAGYTVVNIENRLWSTGPFIRWKNTSVFRAETTAGVFWFRFGFSWNGPEIQTGDWE